MSGAAVDRFWRHDPKLAQAWFCFLDEGIFERLWVHLDESVPEIGGYRGTLISRPRRSLRVRHGDEVCIVALVNLRDWICECLGCRADLHFDDLGYQFRLRFRDRIGDRSAQVFSTRCPLCHASMLVRSRRLERSAPRYRRALLAKSLERVRHRLSRSVGLRPSWPPAGGAR